MTGAGMTPSDEHMREMAERFLSNEDRTRSTAKHLACYVLTLLDERRDLASPSTSGNAPADLQNRRSELQTSNRGQQA